MKAVDITKDRVERQLAAVIDLFEYNAAYLEESEKLWIDHIISTTITVVSDAPNSDHCVVEPERSSRSQGWLKEQLSTRILRSRIKEAAQPPAEDHLKVLLNASESLNSAINLLSCCYDRWRWLKYSRLSDAHLSTTANGLKDFLDWKRQNSSYGGASSSLESCQRQSFATDRLTGSDAVPSHRLVGENSEARHSLFVVDTVERWRQNAEDALNSTIKRYQGRSLRSQRSDWKVNPRKDPDIRSVLPAQTMVPEPSVAISKPEVILCPSDSCARSHTRDGNKSIVTLLPHHDCSTFSNNTVYDCPPVQGLHCHSRGWSNPATTFSSSSTSLSLSPPLPAQRRHLLLQSLQNSFEKEPVTTQAPGLSPAPPHMSFETIRNISASHDSFTSEVAPRLEMTPAKANVSDERSYSGVSSESNVSVSAASSLSSNRPTVFLQNKSVSSGFAYRSRGRLWLEQQLESGRGDAASNMT